MISLKAFGSADLRGDDNRALQAILAQPKRLALLVYLAVAAPRGFHRRDTLLGLLWPELDETRARAALSRAIHYIRTAIGDTVLVNRGHEELGLDWALLSSDVAEFEDALDRGALADALALYRGPLLPGFFVDETPEFDRWLESERARLQTRALHAARQLSEKEEAAGRIVPAVDWARRCLELAPQDEPAVRRLMLLLERSGDRAGAIRAFDELTKLLEKDVGVEPSAETKALRDAVRARDVVPESTPALEYRRASPATPIAREVIVVQAPPPTRRSWNPIVRATVATTALGAGVALIWAAARFTSSGVKAGAPERLTVAIRPFTTAGTSQQTADSIYERLGAALDTMPSIRKARRARFSLESKVSTVGDELRLEAILYDSVAGSDPIARTRVHGAIGEGGRLAEDVAWQLNVVAASNAKSLDPTGTAARPPQASAGVEGMAEGETAYRAGRFNDAVRGFRKAVDADTSNALAYYGLSKAANWAEQSGVAGWSASMAMQRVATVTPLDQMRLRAWYAFMTAQPRDAERLLRLLVAQSPSEADANFTLGEVLFHWGAGLGWPLSESNHAFSIVDSSAIMSLGSLIHLTRIAGMDGDAAQVESVARRALALQPDAAQALELRALRAFAGTAAGDQDQAIAGIMKADETIAQSVATYVAIAAPQNDRVMRAVDALSGPTRSAALRASAEVLRSALIAARGRTDVFAMLAASKALPPARIAEFRAALAVAPFVTLSRDSLEGIRSSLRQIRVRAAASLYDATHDFHDHDRLYLLGLLSARLGDTKAATVYADSLQAPPFQDRANRELRMTAAHLVRATLLRADGKSAEALAILGGPTSSPDFVIPGLLRHPIAYDRFLRAELLRDLHRDAEALRWYGTFPDAGGYDLPYLAPALFRRAELKARRGDAAGAKADRERAEKLWSGASPEFTQWLGKK